MKIALCLHGLFDSTTDGSSNGYDGYNHIKKHILDIADTDVFIHSWDTEKSSEITKLYNPTSAVFENPKDFNELVNSRGLNNLSGTPRSPQSVLSHLYSVTESMKLPYITNSEYDIVIKARFDLGRINRDTSGPGKSNPYPVQCINFQTEIESDKIYMADWNHFKMGPADMWFYGSMDTMKLFTTLYNSLDEQMEFRSPFHTFATQIEGNPGDLSNSIAFYKWWMIQNGLWEKRINLETIWE
jgi:hypothetical protein